MRGFVFNSILTIGIIASLGLNYYFFSTRQQSNFLKEIETTRSKINEDMTNEIVMSRFNTIDNNQIEMARMQGYNEGILACAFKLDPKENQISSIWHSGYSRGLEQTAFVEEMGYEKGYASGWQVGQKETMTAIQNILKSGDNIQKALEKFATDLQNKNTEEKILTQKNEKNSSK
jgi:hypothetical protein